jgi:hypothetical protein
MALLVGYAHMQMRAVTRDGASERKDLEVAIQHLGLFLPSPSQCGSTEAANPCHHEGGAVPARIEDSFQDSPLV